MSDNRRFYSSTAEMTCLFRAKSFGEKRSHFKGDDFVAVIICNALNSFFSMINKSFILDDNLFNHSIPPGVYEYILGRTNFLDNIFKHFPPDFKQVFILGAGFDSRACRFQQQLSQCQVYEVDHPDMQQQKLALFKKTGIDFPANVGFIAVDFSRQSFSDLLAQHSAPPGEKCFFVLEGLTYYLEPARVADIFAAISQHGAPGSQVFFDYADAGAITGDNTQYGLQECVEEVRKLGETWKFGFAAGQAAQFLAEYHFTITEQFTSRDMEERYFTDEHQNRLAKVSSSHTLVRARLG